MPLTAFQRELCETSRPDFTDLRARFSRLPSDRPGRMLMT